MRFKVVTIEFDTHFRKWLNENLDGIFVGLIAGIAIGLLITVFSMANAWGYHPPNGALCDFWKWSVNPGACST